MYNNGCNNSDMTWIILILVIVVCFGGFGSFGGMGGNNNCCFEDPCCNNHRGCC